MKRVFFSVFTAAICVAAMPSWADTNITEDVVLSSDVDWTDRGVVTVDAGVRIDLNGHSLRVKAITGDGYVTDLSNDTAPSIAPEYVPLQYLQSTTAGKQYIDTGYCHTSTSFVEIKFNYPALAAKTSSDKWYSYFGGGLRDQTCSFGGWMWGKNDSNTHWKSTGQNEGTGANAAANTDYIAHLDKQSTCWITDGNNRTILGKTWTGKKSDWGSITPVTAYLFGHHKRQNSDGTDAGLYTPYVGVKIYWCRISTSRSNGTLVRNYIPARRLTDGAIGMYDKVSKTLYRNANSGADFTAGAATENLAATDADIAAAGSLILDVDDTLSTSTLPLIRGKMKLVKVGSGTLVADRANLAHTCGTEILEGTVSCAQSGNTPFGTAGCTVTVGTNTVGTATLDLNGKSGFTSYTFVLAGGILKNSANIPSPNTTAQLKTIRLTADSTVSADSAFGIVAGTTTETTLDLGGHTLTKTGVSAFYFDRCTAASAGRIVSNAGTIEMWYGASDLRLVTLEMGANSQLRVNGTSGTFNASPLLLGGYVAKTASVDRDSGFTGTIKVYDMFRPETDFYHGCELQDGATLDLSSRSTTLPARGRQVLNGTSYRMTDLTFASAAESIIVHTGSREIEEGDRLVSWSAAQKPSILTEFVLACDGATPAERKLWVRVEDGGLDVVSTAVPAFAEWDVSANGGEGGWIYFKEDGAPFTGEWPGVDSTITVRFSSWEEYTAIKAITGLAPAGYLMKGTFSTPAGSGTNDLTQAFAGGESFAMSPNAIIDAGANALILPNALFEGDVPFTVTGSEGGTLIVDVAENVELHNTAATLSGALKLVKRGAGTFVATKTGQTYTGGTVIEDGLLKCASAGTNKQLGDYAGDVVVGADGVFDLAGKINFTGYRFVLRGGKIKNTVCVSEYHTQPWLANVRLEADSEFEAAGGPFGMINKSGNSYIASTLDLNGYTLRMSGNVQIYIVKCTATAGTIIMHGLNVESWHGASDFSRVHVITEDKMKLCVRQDAPLSFGDYIADSTGQSNDTTGYKGTLTVSGTFRPTTGYFNGCTLQNGATLDLSGWTNGTFNTHGLYAPGAAASRTTATFVGGANITLSLNGRRDLSRMAKENQYIVEWEKSAKPADSVTFTLDSATAMRGYTLVRDDGGLKLFPSGLIIIVK
jgi:autotransporter-associated beta strand protein